MKTVRVELGPRSYPIEIGDGLLDRLGGGVAGALSPSSVIVVTDSNVGPLYLGRVLKALTGAGLTAKSVELPAGEEMKSLPRVSELYDRLFDCGIDRKSVIVALGGGVVGDVTGFAAATVLRGVAFVQTPTTLLAQVDSSVGGKTGVNHASGKNMIGAFWQPALVVIDTGTLGTLPARELSAGAAEVVKTAVIRDERMFERLEAGAAKLMSLDRDVAAEMIARSCEIKAEVVSADEREDGLRAILNFGHTFGHAIEAASGYGRLLHGEAVAIGMVAAGRLALDLGMWKESEHARMLALLQGLRLPTAARGLSPERLIDLMRRDKKARSRKMSFVLPERIGAVRVVSDVPERAVMKALEAVT